PLSYQQEQVVFFQTLAPSTNAYNSQSTIKIRGPLDLGLLARAINAITARHELLRTTYTHIEHEPVQIVHDEFLTEIPLFDLTKHSEPTKRRDELILETLQTVFDLSKLPLAKWAVLKLGDVDHDLVLVEHHIVHDGWTLSIIFRELEEFYGAFLERRDPRLTDLPVQYRDFASWQRENIEKDYFSSQLEFWRNELDGAPKSTPLPYDFARPRKQTFRGDLISIDLPERLATRMKGFSKENRFTFFEIMFSVFSILIHKLSKESDVCIGTALANREKPELASLIGMFVNVVVVRSRLDSAATFRDYVSMIKGKIVDANMNQSYPFPRLIQKLNLPRDSAINPIFQTMFSFHDSSVLDPILGEANGFIDHLHGNSSAKQDLDVVIIPRSKRSRGSDSESDERISMIWEFNSDLFKKETIQRFVDQYLHVLDACLADGGLHPQVLGTLPEKEVSKIMQFSKPVPNADLRIDELIGRNFSELADKPCVVERDKTWTYRDLNHLASTLGVELQRSIRLEEPVGIILPRGFTQIASQLAIVSAGGVFVPIDPSTPQARIELILKDAGVRLVVTLEQHRQLVPSDLKVIVPAREGAPAGANTPPLRLPVGRGQLAYLIFTSGSTGTPKGVGVQLEALYGYAARNIIDFELSSSSRTLVYNSPGFDTSLGDIWPCLAAGATLYVPSDEMRYSVSDLITFLTTNEVAFADIPTAMVEKMLKEDWPADSSLRTLLVGGEKLKSRPTPEHRFKLFNEYGPTETTISATSGRVLPLERAAT
ncbi:MAG: condensation domain-containing protein, partial [Bdellovibrionota bacterium]